MCQLTYSNLHHKQLNKLAVYSLAQVGSAKKHKDGCGFVCSTNEHWKTETAAHLITNLGEILNVNILDTRPVPFHIRLASWGIKVTKENSHPFLGEHYILMHNGTLLPKDGKEPADKEVDSDSLRFLNALDSVKKKNPKKPFVEIFNETMDSFSGKFAFIIRELETKTDYIIRGRTAELWKSFISVDGEEIGYVINTDRDTIREAFMFFVNAAQIMIGKKVTYSEPVLLALETIYVAEKEDIKILGKTKETFPVYKNTKVETKTTVQLPAQTVTSGNKSYTTSLLDKKGMLSMANRIHDYLHDHNMSLLDLQLLFQIISTKSVLELVKEDFEIFVEYIIPKSSAPKKVRQRVSNILSGADFPSEVYAKYGLAFPWPVNDSEKVIKALEDYIK